MKLKITFKSVLKITLLTVLGFGAFAILRNPPVLAEEFPIFDGRAQGYNGKFYPRIDIIEWSDEPGELSHMEFHIFKKDEPIEMGFQLDTKTGQKVMMVRYAIKRKWGETEYQCRRVLTPAHFTDKFFVYRDTSDKDFENVIVTMDELKTTKNIVQIQNPMKYAACEMEDAEKRMPASSKSPATNEKDDNVKSGASIRPANTNSDTDGTLNINW